MKSYSSIKTSTFLMVFTLIFNSCSNDSDEIIYDLTGNWKVIYFIDNGNKITKTKQNTWLDYNNGDITANFTEPQNDGKGEISGFKVTNGYSAQFEIKANGKISIGAVFQTFINEPEWTKLYQISQAEYYEVKNSQLLIYYNDKKNVIAFEKK
ncbi:hypothetical protein [Flagellimonas onchidii]|uniref:hypothetical protein n=1 Tax=Flagellimonas onchidii TaxID=2562684 RepID=UPI0010A66859|nr:hypothetical protein [Allomuricauda onchidii]